MDLNLCFRIWIVLITQAMLSSAICSRFKLLSSSSMLLLSSIWSSRCFRSSRLSWRWVLFLAASLNMSWAPGNARKELFKRPSPAPLASETKRIFICWLLWATNFTKFLDLVSFRFLDRLEFQFYNFLIDCLDRLSRFLDRLHMRILGSHEISRPEIHGLLAEIWDMETWEFEIWDID